MLINAPGHSDNGLSAYCANFNASSTQNLCIQNACTTYNVQCGDNCTALAKANNITSSQVINQLYVKSSSKPRALQYNTCICSMSIMPCSPRIAGNSMLDATCSNLALSVGQNVCVGKSGRAVPTITATGAPASIFTTPATAPTDIAANTTTNCGQFYEVQLGDYGNLVCLKFSISLDDFLFLNPAVNLNCTNLFAEESYCVAPVGDISSYVGSPGYVAPINSFTLTSAWAEAPKATYVPPVLNITNSNPLAAGTRTDCWAVVDGNLLQHAVNGTMFYSTCSLLADVYGVTLAELQNW